MKLEKFKWWLNTQGVEETYEEIKEQRTNMACNFIVVIIILLIALACAVSECYSEQARHKLEVKRLLELQLDWNSKVEIYDISKSIKNKQNERRNS